AEEYPRFAAWNAATGERAGTGGYPDAALYPLVPAAELTAGALVKGVTSGFSSYYYRARSDGPATIELDTDADRNAGTLVPFDGSSLRLDRMKPLPAALEGEAIVVVSGTTPKKTDAPFTLSLTPALDGGADASPEESRPASGGGCSVSTATPLPTPCSRR